MGHDPTCMRTHTEKKNLSHVVDNHADTQALFVFQNVLQQRCFPLNKKKKNKIFFNSLQMNTEKQTTEGKKKNKTFVQKNKTFVQKNKTFVQKNKTASGAACT